MRIRPSIKKTLLLCSVAVTVSVVLALVAIATPMDYRAGFWRSFPLVDHRLLPHLSALFAAAFGAFFGSLSAFYLGRIQQRTDRREKRHGALIAAQYALTSQWNIIEGIRVQHLEKFRADSNRFAKLALFFSRVSPEFVPFNELTFVLESEDPNILQQIHIAQQSYQSCMDALTLRNQQLEQFYRNPRVEHRILNFETGAGITQAAPEDLFFLKQATDSLFSSVDSALPKLSAAVEALHTLIKLIFPGMRALHMRPQALARN